jgi:arginine-tRNA-protein transferase
MLDVSPAELDHLLERGWRRFGPAYFRPACGRCSECVPLRVPVPGFRPSKGQRRVRARARDLRLAVGIPVVDAARLELHRRWQGRRAAQRGWREHPLEADDYRQQFAFPHPSAREYTLWDHGGAEPVLVAVALVDETPSALSAVYTFHDPDRDNLSLGTASILAQLEVAALLGKRWLYLGYWVEGCISSAYKARFQPHELLEGWPALAEAPRWRPVEGRFAARSAAGEGEG